MNRFLIRIFTLVTVCGLFMVTSGCDSKKDSNKKDGKLAIANPDPAPEPVDGGEELTLGPPFLNRFPALWAGTGIFTDNQSKSKNCTISEMSTVENARFFAIQKVSAHCEGVQFPWYNKVMTKSGDRLLINGSDVGFLNPNRFQIELNDRGLLWRLSGEYNEQGLVIQERQESAGNVSITTMQLKVL